MTVDYGGQGAGTIELYAANRGSNDFRLIRTAGTSESKVTTFRAYPDQHKILYARHVEERAS